MSLCTGLLAGAYPAFVLSGFTPLHALKSDFFKTSGQGTFRKVLVTTQFAVSITLLIVMAFIYRQVNYMNAKDLGFQPEQVLSISLHDENAHRKVAQMKELLKVLRQLLLV